MQLKEIRKLKGISQSQAARGLNITQTAYNRYENGQRQIPNNILLAMADYFGVSSDEILGRPAQPDQPDTDSRPKTRESRILVHGIDKLPKEQREQALKLPVHPDQAGHLPSGRPRIFHGWVRGVTVPAVVYY